jgi:hypothetical protein
MTHKTENRQQWSSRGQVHVFKGPILPQSKKLINAALGYSSLLKMLSSQAITEKKKGFAKHA